MINSKKGSTMIWVIAGILVVALIGSSILIFSGDKSTSSDPDKSGALSEKSSNSEKTTSSNGDTFFCDDNKICVHATDYSREDDRKIACENEGKTYGAGECPQNGRTGYKCEMGHQTMVIYKPDLVEDAKSGEASFCEGKEIYF
jgi:hypothetical protein